MMTKRLHPIYVDVVTVKENIEKADEEGLLSGEEHLSAVVLTSPCPLRVKVITLRSVPTLILSSDLTLDS